MKYLLTVLLVASLAPRTLEDDLSPEVIEFLIEHDAYDDLMETFYEKNNDGSDNPDGSHNL
jgi:hypothetical protein